MAVRRLPFYLLTLAELSVAENSLTGIANFSHIKDSLS
jgi:hypothetical protein